MSRADALRGLGATRLALLARRAREERLNNFPEPIAVTGIGCRFPGGANGPGSYWSLLLDGFDGVREIPADRWPIEDWFDPDPSTAARLSVRHGGFLDDVSGFDHDFFDIPRREADRMDPHQRLALETAWEALEDAGLPAESLFERPVGVFLASYNNDYVLHQYLRPEAINERTLTGAIHSVAANRISHFLGLYGPSITVDTACSSSLVAVHLACRSLREGACDVALAGGVSVIARPEPFIALSKAGFMAPDGRCKTFDASADGFGRGEGGGFVVLKRLADALAAGDRIDAVVRGSAVNQDGRSTILAAPNGRSQVAVVRAALEDGLVDPSRVSFIEAHGTGTRLGDPIEVEALAEALGPPAAAPRWIGSVKANIGHLEAAAGIAGLIKAVLCLRHRRIPRQQQYREENPMLRLADHGFAVPVENTDWNDGAPLCAGVSSFGVGGTNAHVVLEQPPELPVADEDPRPASMLCLSARNREALDQTARNFATMLDDAEQHGQSLASICAASLVRRSRFSHRIAVTGDSAGEIAAALRATVDEDAVGAACTGAVDAAVAPGIVFVFNGQGSQWLGMGTRLAAEEPSVAETLREIDELFEPRAGWSLREALCGEAEGLSLDDTCCAQPAIFAVQVAIARLLEDWGVVPDAVIGHSIGELAAAHVAGLLTLEEAVETVFQRGRIMQQAAAGGAMLAARMSEAEALEALAPDAAAQLAAINGPTSVVFSGDADGIETLAARLEADGTRVKKLAVQYAFHSNQMAPFEDELRQSLREFAAAPPRCTFYSTVTGSELVAADFDPAYVARNIVSPVRLHDAVQRALDDGNTLFVEVGANPALAGGMSETVEAAGVDATIVSTLSSRQPGRRALLETLGTLYCGGVEPDAHVALGPPRGDLPLPTYPWQRARCWLDAPERGAPGRGASDAPLIALLGRRLDSPAIPHPVFEQWLDAASPEVRDHRIGGEVLVPAAMMVEMARRAGAIAFGKEPLVSEARFIVPVALSEEKRQIHLSVRPGQGSDAACVELNARLEGGPWTLCFKARLEDVAAEATEGASERLRTPDDRAAACPRVVGRDEFYEKAAGDGGTFGPGYQRVQKLCVGDAEAVAFLEPSDVTGPGFEPAVIDSAIQPVLALLDDDSALFVPAEIQTFHRTGAGRCTAAHIRRAAVAEGSYRFDVDLLDADGTVVARIEGLAMKKMPRGGIAAADPARSLYETTWVAADEDVTGAVQDDEADRWVVLGDAAGRAEAWAESLAAAGGNVVHMSHAEMVASRSTAGDDARPTTWVDCSTWDLGDESNAERAAGVLASLVESITAWATEQAGAADRVVLLTRGVTDATGSGLPWGSACAGLVRTLRREHPEARVLMVDLEEGSLPEASMIATILRSDAEEPVLALRDGRLLVPRWDRIHEAASPRESASIASQTRVVVLSEPGNLASATPQATERTAPKGDQLEVAVRVAALNFRDVLAGLGLVDARTSGALGHECAGVVTRVGPEVDDIRPGDRVVALAEGSFGDHVVCRSTRVFPIPADLGFEDAATLPVAYLTAYHALRLVAGLEPGQKILIHAGAGGVGQSAVRMALAIGAEVFATAGSPEKRRFLSGLGVSHVADSRSLDFHELFRDAAGAEGIDVVLNSLTGEAVDRGLDLLGEGGTFVELGKRDLRSPDELATQRGIRYVAFDLFDEVDKSPEAYRQAFTEILEGIADGRIAPLPRIRYPRARVAEALQTMSRGGHSGKLVVHVEGTTNPEVRPDATYLVTGGTGAVGLHTVEWLVDRGARHVLVASRRAPQDEVAARISELEKDGAEIRWVATDMTDRASVDELVAHARGGEHPLRGVVHAAGEIDDGLLADARPDQLEKPLGAKVLGARYLVLALEAEELDFLLLYSAAGSVLDPAGQGGYAVANALTDGLAVFLRMRGWPAVSVAWGMWEGGMAARLDAGLRQRWEGRGLVPIAPGDAGVMLDAALRADRAVLAAVLVDWQTYSAKMERVDPLFERLTALGSEKRSGRDLLADLTSLPRRRRRAAAREHLVRRLAGVLGVDAEDLDIDRPFREIGLDSLMAVEYRNVLTRDFGRSLPATLTFDYPDVPSLLEHLATIVPAIAGDTPEADASTPVSAGVVDTVEKAPHADDDDIAALSDAEAERLLIEELGITEAEATGR